MNETFMRERPVLPLIAAMSLPMVLSMLVNSLYNIVDSFFVAQISEASMTALSLVFPIQNLINALAIGFGVGLNAAISFYLGAERRDRASAAAVHGLALSAVHGVVLTGLTIALLPSFLEMFTQDPEVLALGVRYGRTVFCFSLLLSLGLAYEKIFQAVGRMKVPMAALLTGCLTNIILDPLLIFGPGPFPKLGIEGAALATGIGQTLTLLVYLAAWRSCALPITLSRRDLAWDWQLNLRLYSVGIPATLSLALPSLLISALNSILSVFSPIYVVILGIYYKLQTFLYLPASGIVQGDRRGTTLAPGIYLEFGEKFQWPDLSAPEEEGRRFCYGLRDQVGVLWDGTVVPCCLDHEGDVPLGNLYEASLEEILSGPRAEAIYQGFSQGEAREALCRRCAFTRRFQ